MSTSTRGRAPKTLPINSPIEVLSISPENLEVANCYLATQSIMEVSRLLELPTHIISDILARRDIRAYVDNVFMDVGYNSQFKITGIMDEVIEKKLQEMAEADIGSSKDIIEILTLRHKMNMDYLDKQIKLEALKNGNVKNQVNVQVNDMAGGTNYSALLQKLVKNNNE
jgi:hypothetical protein